MFEEICSKFFEDRFIFDFDKSYTKLLSEFSHISLFSISLHLLRCTRSCDKKSYYCRLSSRVRELTKNCSFFQVFKCPQELFVCFSSVRIRMYINCTLNALFFSSTKVIPNERNKAFNVSLADEKKILLIIFKHGKILLDKFWYTTNYKFFYDFFDQLDTVNSSFCFKNFVSKPKFGPYNFPDYCHVTWEYH